jgi:hypothetical protein
MQRHLEGGWEMRALTVWTGIIILVASISSAFAYDDLTHNQITKEAYKTSVLHAGYLGNLGMSETDKFDVSDISTNGNMIDDEDNNLVNDGSPLGWLREGSIDEDNLDLPTIRFRHHFFNPIDGSGLHFTVSAIFPITGYPAPSWGLEDDATYAEQQYSIKHARDYFYKGLTMTTKKDRDHNIALTFRTLGQVIHLLEDMAQPQHTRNDPHGGFFGLGLPFPQIFGQLSRYEAYVNRKDTRNTFAYSGYPVVAFNDYRSYFAASGGEGISQFSNRNFVSQGTNFTRLEQGNHALGFPEPTLDLDNTHDELIQATDIDGNPVSGVMTFFGNTIADNYTGDTSAQNDKMTTYSLFDQDLIKRYKDPTFTLNDRNYNAAANILLPRAVGYSAGLLNYFFRGQIDAVNPQMTTTGATMKIKNNTPNEAVEKTDATPGKFVVSYQYTPSGGGDSVYGVSNEVELAESIPSGSESATEYSFTFTDSIPADARDVEYTLVFRGKLGNEDDAVAAQKIAEAMLYGSVYTGSFDEIKICKINPATGNVVWNNTVSTKESFYSTHSVGITNYNVSCNGAVLNKDTGASIGMLNLPDGYVIDTVGDATRIYVLMADWDTYDLNIYCFDAQTLGLLWTKTVVPSQSWIAGEMYVDEDGIYVAGNSTYPAEIYTVDLLRYDPANGTVLNSISLNEPDAYMYSGGWVQNKLFNGDKDHIYLSTLEGSPSLTTAKVYSFDKSLGSRTTMITADPDDITLGTEKGVNGLTYGIRYWPPPGTITPAGKSPFTVDAYFYDITVQSGGIFTALDSGNFRRYDSNGNVIWDTGSLGYYAFGIDY